MNTLIVAWRGGDASHGCWTPVGRLEHSDGLYRFRYTNGVNQAEGFRPFSRMEDLDHTYESDSLFPVFANRLLSPSRPEYRSALEWGGFNATNPPDAIALLSVTEGIRQTDAIELFPEPVVNDDGWAENTFFLHGLRWLPEAAIQRVAQLTPGERLVPMPDPCNEVDRNAVAVRTLEQPTLLGYVPRYLAPDLAKLLLEEQPQLELTVKRVNADAPLQQRLLCRLKARWPEHVRPCSGPLFEPISNTALATHTR